MLGQARSLNRGPVDTSTRTPTRTLRFSAARTMRGRLSLKETPCTVRRKSSRGTCSGRLNTPLYRSQYDCELPPPASTLSGLTSGASPCGNQYSRWTVQGRTLPQCKTLECRRPLVVDLQSTVAQDSHP